MLTNTKTVHRLITSQTLRSYCIKAIKTRTKNQLDERIIGQPTFQTHPHLLKENEVTPNITRDEYQTRRQKLSSTISQFSFEKNKNLTNHLVIIPAASKKYMSDKIPYVFRQNTDFLYLTGCQEPDCCVVLTIDETTKKTNSILFTRDKDAHSELWDGPRTYPEDAPSFFGVDQSLPISELKNFLYMYHKSYKNLGVWYDFLNPIQENVQKSVVEMFQKTQSNAWESPNVFLHKLRLFKSPVEVELMQKSCDVASEAFIQALKSSKSGIGENQLFAIIDYECRMNGAEYLAYPPVVAGGNRATTIHYINNNQLVHDGELVLVDAGCEYHGYSSDITRTWPINGRFTDHQRVIYEIVFNVQQDLIKFCTTFPTLDQLFERMCFLLGKELVGNGIIKKQINEEYLMKAAYQLCPHHVSHYLGMDVHDTSLVNRNIQIQPGMILTIEPGIYVNAKNKLVPKEFQGIGVRIEDDVLITEQGPVVLSRNCPKRLGDIEEIINQSSK